MCIHTGDMYSHDGNADEPEWVKTEREQFVEFRDKNRDGKMDKEETKDWIDQPVTDATQIPSHAV